MPRYLSAPLLTLLLSLSCAAALADERSELKLWVVDASTENREKPHFDSGLESIRRVLATSNHDTFRRVAAGTHGLADGKVTRIPLEGAYTLEAASPVPTQDGRYRVRLRILMKSDDSPPREIEALSTELLLHAEKPVLVRGLKKEGGRELILVLSLTVHTGERTPP